MHADAMVHGVFLQQDPRDADGLRGPAGGQRQDQQGGRRGPRDTARVAG